MEFKEFLNISLIFNIEHNNELKPITLLIKKEQEQDYLNSLSSINQLLTSVNDISYTINDFV